MIDSHELLDPAPSPPSLTHAAAQLVEDVARRAHAKWTTRCQAGDHQRQDWLEAEAELAVEAALARRLAEAEARLVRVSAERHEAERRLVAEHAVSSLLAVADTLIAAAPKLAQAVCEHLDWDVGVVWLLDRDANLLRCLEVWHSPQIEIPAFERETRLRTFSAGIGLPGSVWAGESTVWIPDVTAEADFSRAASAAADGLRGAIGFPVCNGQTFVGVLEFFSRDVRLLDELCAETMTNIAAQISQFIERRSAERRLHRQEDDRRIGQEIQQGLLPKTMPRLAGFEISGRSSAPNQVGGDCFDFIALPRAGRDCISVLIADASGHGIGAALLTVQTRAYLRGVALTGTNVGQLLDLTNQCLSADGISDHFVTACLLRLDPGAHALSYSSAGHWPGYVLNAHGQTRALLHSTGLPLGIDPANTFPAAALTLEPGDLVLLITDGITEAVAPDGELFGMERTLRLVRHHQAQPPGDIVAALFAAVGDFCGNHYLDDLTAVVIKVQGVA